MQRGNGAGGFPFDARDGGCPSVGSCSPAAWSARRIESQALATLAALAQISTPSTAHLLLVLKFRRIEIGRKKPRLPFEQGVLHRLWPLMPIFVVIEQQLPPALA